ncbi:MAG: AMP-binding protein [Actinobacteria bacterium]|nr:AMP-binding protein [Actinomycetota bacterium]
MLEARTLWELISKRADATPDAPMVIDDTGRELTFGEYAERVERVGVGLQAWNVKAGDVVSWQLPTWQESMLIVGALSRMRVIQNPILHIYREREVGFIVREAQTKLLIVPEEFGGFDFASFARGIAADVEGLDVKLITRPGLAEVDQLEDLPKPPRTDFEDEAPVRWYFYTSGTTANPKGAQHTDATIMAVSRGMCESLELTPDDRSALVFPFPHIGGIIWLFSSLLVGFPNVIDQAFNPETTIGFLDGQDVTLAGAGTYFHQAYLAAKKENAKLFSSVRGFPGGGAPKPPQLHHAMREAWPDSAGILSGYGLTEAPILTMATPDDEDEALANTEGRAMPGVELKLVTLDGEVATAGEEGEVRAKAPQLMVGYLDASLGEEAFDEDGFFRTGDLGKLDEDGFLTITGRVKDVIIRKGENISAKEVEDVLYDHDAIADVAVIGLPDDETGERACAVLVVADGADAPTLPDVQGFLEQQKLNKRKWPEQVEVVDALPRSPAGKVLKFELRDRFAGTERPQPVASDDADEQAAEEKSAKDESSAKKKTKKKTKKSSKGSGKKSQKKGAGEKSAEVKAAKAKAPEGKNPE